MFQKSTQKKTHTHGVLHRPCNYMSEFLTDGVMYLKYNYMMVINKVLMSQRHKFLTERKCSFLHIGFYILLC